MIYIGILFNKDGTHLLSDDFTNDVSLNLKNEKIKRERITSRAFIKCFFEEKTACKMPKILYTDRGKPYFYESSISFSHSRTDSLCLVILSDSSECGADIEFIKSEDKKAGRAITRFLTYDFCELIEKKCSYNNNSEFPDYEWNFYILEKGKIRKAADNEGISLLSVCEEESSNETNFVIRERPYCEEEEKYRAWCALEALLKAEGGGFSSYKKENLLDLASDRPLYAPYLCVDGKNYAMAFVAERSKNEKLI